MAVRFQLRRDTAANWSANNPILADGEPGIETDSSRIKIGDGVSTWNSLAYELSNDFADLTNTPTTVSGYGITDAYTKTETDTEISTAISNLVDTAPGTLDTLNELAAALGDDPNFATTVTDSIASKSPIANPQFTGNVGIGISPTVALHVNGSSIVVNNLLVGGDFGVSGAFKLEQDTAGVFWYDDTDIGTIQGGVKYSSTNGVELYAGSSVASKFNFKTNSTVDILNGDVTTTFGSEASRGLLHVQGANLLDGDENFDIKLGDTEIVRVERSAAGSGPGVGINTAPGFEGLDVFPSIGVNGQIVVDSQRNLNVRRVSITNNEVIDENRNATFVTTKTKTLSLDTTGTADESTINLFNGVEVNGTWGYAIRKNSLNTLFIDRYTASNFSTRANAIQITSTGAINMQTSASVTDATARGIRLAPNAVSDGFHLVSSQQLTGDPQPFQGLGLAGTNIRLYTSADAVVANSRMLIDNTGATSFSGTVSAAQFSGPGCDWYLLSTASPASVAAVDFSLDENFDHYALVFTDVKFAVDNTVLVGQLLDETSALLGNITYYSSVLGHRSASTGLNLLNQTNTNLWYFVPYNITENGVSGSASGTLMFYNLRGSERWKKFSSSVTQYFFDGTILNAAHSTGGGIMDTTLNASILRIIAGSSNYATGTFKLYGIR